VARVTGRSSGVHRAALRRKKTLKLMEVMKRQGLDALLLNRIENVRYSTDFRPVVSLWFQGSYSSIVTSGGESILLTVAGDFMRSEYYMPWIEDIRVMHQAGRAEELARIFRQYRLSRIGYDQLSFEDHAALGAAAKGVQLVNAAEEVANERAVKLDEEVKLMQAASAVTEASIKAALASAKPGMHEYEISAEGEYAARMLGAEGMSWSLATFSGLNTGLMLRHDSEKVVRDGEFLILGYATMYRGYNTDITSTTIVGRPSEKQKEVYTATYDSFIAALESTKPGAMTRDIHEAAERIIKEHGFGKYSFSRIQPILHGVGMNVYEPPFSPEPGKREPSMKLRVGHTLAIEPAVTLFDNLKVGGCRIGETLAVTESGYRLLSNASRSDAHETLYEK